MSLFRFIDIHPCIMGMFLGKERKYLNGFNTIDVCVRVEFRRINDRRVRVEIWFRKDSQQKFENVQERLSKVESEVRKHIGDCYENWEWRQSREKKVTPSS